MWAGRQPREAAEARRAGVVVDLPVIGGQRSQRPYSPWSMMVKEMIKQMVTVMVKMSARSVEIMVLHWTASLPFAAPHRPDYGVLRED